MDQLPSFYDKHHKIWSGAKRSFIYHPEYSIGQIINFQLKNWPKNIVQIDDISGTTLTNADVLQFSVRIAQHFRKMRLRNDDIVGIAARNSTYVAAVANACFFNTSPLYAVNPSLQLATLTHLFNLTKPRVIFCDGSIYEKVKTATKHFDRVIYTLVDHLEDVPKVEDLLEPTSTEMFYKAESLMQGPDQTMAILCSSGTTGLPKAVCISNETMKSIAEGLLTSEDILFSASGLDWVTGLYTHLASMSLGCTRIITNKPFEAETFVKLIDKYKVTWSVIPPRHMASLAASPHITIEKVKSIRVLSCGGGVISLATLGKIQALFKNAIINFSYAFTEFGGVSMNFGLEHGTSVGKLMPGVKARIVDDTGNNLGPNAVGEVLLQRGYGWPGYYGNPIESQKMMDGLGWFHSGDLGYFDDKHFLYVVDRKKDILKYQGLHYWSTEIEEVVQKMPGVEDACVFGIYGEVNGDEAGALVVLEKGSKLTENDVKNYVAEQLPEKHKHLHAGVIFVDRLPQNENGKVIKRQAKEEFIKLSKVSNGNVDK